MHSLDAAKSDANASHNNLFTFKSETDKRMISDRYHATGVNARNFSLTASNVRVSSSMSLLSDVMNKSKRLQQLMKINSIGVISLVDMDTKVTANDDRTVVCR